MFWQIDAGIDYEVTTLLLYCMMLADKLSNLFSEWPSKVGRAEILVL
jgi:hypothetical protein